jgi:hypothetical protein
MFHDRNLGIGQLGDRDPRYRRHLEVEVNRLQFSDGLTGRCPIRVTAFERTLPFTLAG